MPTITIDRNGLNSSSDIFINGATLSITPEYESLTVSGPTTTQDLIVANTISGGALFIRNTGTFNNISTNGLIFGTISGIGVDCTGLACSQLVFNGSSMDTLLNNKAIVKRAGGPYYSAQLMEFDAVPELINTITISGAGTTVKFSWVHDAATQSALGIMNTETITYTTPASHFVGATDFDSFISIAVDLQNTANSGALSIVPTLPVESTVFISVNGVMKISRATFADDASDNTFAHTILKIYADIDPAVKYQLATDYVIHPITFSYTSLSS